jgi:GntR family transcriptional regulator
MLLNLTDISSEPLQSQIIRQIRARILGGELSANETLPSIRVLANEQRVSVITVQRAYEHLEREGLIHSRRGKGFFVSPIDENTKKEMAMQRFIDKIEPILRTALDEGVSAADILSAIKSFLKSKKDKGAAYGKRI